MEREVTMRRFGRRFGRRGLLAAGLLGVATAGLRGVAFAATDQAAVPLLIQVNLRGGMDGLHLLSPADDRHFVDLRPAGLRTPAEGEGAGLRLDAPGDTDFRLHPAAAPLRDLWHDGRLALWPAAGLPEATRSHFEAQAMMAAGRGRRRDPAAGGWLGPRVQARGHGPIRAFAAQGSLAPELAGAPRAIALAGLEAEVGPPGGAFGAAMLHALHAGTDTPVALAGREALDGLSSLAALLPRDAAGRIARPAPAPDADTGPAGPFGRALSAVATLARLCPGLAAATVDLGGWDTHEGQAARLAERVRVLATGLAALERDLAGQPRRWTVVVGGEFGRRLRPNRSGGTDHGRAGLMLAFGDPRFGLGGQLGAWPGLAPDALEEGADLRVAVDYRDVFRAVLTDLG